MIWLPDVLSPLRHLGWQLVKGWIRQRFPSVPTISTADLAKWLDQETPPPVVIDTRRAEEYTVSHLPQAIHARTVAAIEAAGIPHNAPVVLYCSVGYRSARLGEALQPQHYQVLNLEGSIFQWANEERLLVTGDQVTRQVHPYNRLWGLLLKPSHPKLRRR